MIERSIKAEKPSITATTTEEASKKLLQQFYAKHVNEKWKELTLHNNTNRKTQIHGQNVFSPYGDNTISARERIGSNYHDFKIQLRDIIIKKGMVEKRQQPCPELVTELQTMPLRLGNSIETQYLYISEDEKVEMSELSYYTYESVATRMKKSIPQPPYQVREENLHKNKEEQRQNNNIESSVASLICETYQPGGSGIVEQHSVEKNYPTEKDHDRSGDGENLLKQLQKQYRKEKSEWQSYIKAESDRYVQDIALANERFNELLLQTRQEKYRLQSEIEMLKVKRHVAYQYSEDTSKRLIELDEQTKKEKLAYEKYIISLKAERDEALKANLEMKKKIKKIEDEQQRDCQDGAGREELRTFHKVQNMNEKQDFESSITALKIGLSKALLAGKEAAHQLRELAEQQAREKRQHRSSMEKLNMQLQMLQNQYEKEKSEWVSSMEILKEKHNKSLLAAAEATAEIEKLNENHKMEKSNYKKSMEVVNVRVTTLIDRFAKSQNEWESSIEKLKIERGNSILVAEEHEKEKTELRRSLNKLKKEVKLLRDLKKIQWKSGLES